MKKRDFRLVTIRVRRHIQRIGGEGLILEKGKSVEDDKRCGRVARPVFDPRSGKYRTLTFVSGLI